MKKSAQRLFFTVFLVVFFTGVSAFAAGFEKPPTGKYFYIKSVQAGNKNLGFWDQPGKKRKFRQGDNLALYARDYNIDQKFRFISAGGGWYYIVSRNGGYVDVAGGKNGNGVNMHIWTGNRSPAQKFKFRHMGKGRWKIYTYWRRAICTPRKYSNNTNVHTWADHNGPWMEWYLIDERTGKKYAPEEAKKVSANADFFIKNKDRAFKYTSSTLVGRNTGYAYVLRIEYNRNVILGIDYTGTDPMTGKMKKVSSIMNVRYNKGKYTSGPSGEFQLAGEADANAKRLSMGHSQGGVSFEVTDKPKSSVIPTGPDFFIKNRDKTFKYENQTAFAGGRKGTEQQEAVCSLLPCQKK